MHNFDEERAKRKGVEFQIGGQTFTTRAFVRPEILATWETETEDGKPTDQLEAADRLIAGFLIPSDAERWAALRANDDDTLAVISIQDLDDMIRFLVEANANRATTAPSASSNGQTSAEDSSKAESSSREETPTA
jgi:hypothetical protein